MNNRVRFTGLLSLLLAFAQVATAAGERISEIHYDNTGTDSGEAIEISAEAGSDVTGWSVVLYNGSNGTAYSTQTLTGTVPATCDTRGVLVLNYPANGIQNGGSTAAGTDSPDAVALVNASGTVVEFLSYEGVLAAVDGPAMGLTSVDIGVRELGNEPIGQSLARNAAGTWSGPGTATFGTCNDSGDTPPPAEVASVTVAPASATIVRGGTQTFSASALDASSQPIPGVAFTWTSSAPVVATINANGVATGVAAGDTVITATAPNGIANTAALRVTVPPPTGLPELRFSEIHYDNSGVDSGEAIEIEGPAGTDITGVTIVLYNGNGGAAYNTQTLSGTIAATCDTRGVVSVSYPQDGIQNGSPDGFALVDASGQIIEFLSYEGSFVASSGPAAGIASTDIVATEGTAPSGQSLQRDPENRWTQTTASFGSCNGDGPPPPTGNTVSFSGRLTSDPPLPVGYEDQLFATVRDATGAVVTTTITWTTETPAIASIDARGVLHALAAGTAIVRATAADGVTTSTYSLPTEVAVASTTAEYVGNAEFGEPQDSDPADDFIVRYPQYTASYSSIRNTPNWVSYELDPSHYGAQDRCDCFTMDPALPATFTRITTADYTDSGTFAGYGIDRGHLARSFDRTSASLDNAVTYLFTNIVPQAADMNQGPWAILENELGDLARFQNKEVYIVTGPAGNKGTLKNEGKVVIPTSTWKVAVILPYNQGLADVDSADDLQIIAVNMPNEPGIRNVAWQTYSTTVDAIEELTGYDLLALLPDNIEHAIESNTLPPEAAISAPTSSTEGSTIALSAAGSTDPDGSIVSYEWNFGDGTSATGADVTHTYTQDGDYTVTLLVTDSDGLTGSVTAAIGVTNVAPTIADFPGGTITAGATFTVSGTFTDPGADTWTATVDWGDGTAVSQASLADRNFLLTHVYATSGAFTVTVTIADDDASTSKSQAVTVQAPIQSLRDARALVDGLVADGKIGRITAIVLKAQISTAEALLSRGRPALAALALRAAILDLDLLVRLRLLTTEDAAPLRSRLSSIIESITTS